MVTAALALGDGAVFVDGAVDTLVVAP